MRKTLNRSMFADSITETKIIEEEKNYASCLGFIYHILCVTCYLSPKPTATATDHAPTNSSTMHGWLIWYKKK